MKAFLIVAGLVVGLIAVFLLGLTQVAVGIFAVLVLLALYFLPTAVANERRKRNLGAIFALNLLLGWTLLGWVAALVWALTTDAPLAAGT